MEVDDAPVVQFELLQLTLQGGGPSDALFDIVSALDPSLFACPASWARTITLRLKSVDDLKLACWKGRFGSRQGRTLVFLFRQGAHAQLNGRRGVCKHISPGRLRGFTASRLPGNRPALRHYFEHMVQLAICWGESARPADKYRRVNWVVTLNGGPRVCVGGSAGFLNRYLGSVKGSRQSE